MSERRLTLAIDCDDVLVPTAQAIIDDYNERFGTKLGLEHMYQPATLDTWGTDDDDVAIERVNEFLRSDAHAAIIPDPMAVEAVHTLAKLHELHLVTGRASFLEPVTAGMLNTYFPDCFQTVEHTNYIVASGNQMVRRSKGEVCRSLGAHALIDDHLQHGHSVLEAQLERVIVFGDYPWNQQDELPTGMVRCVDWDAALREIERIAYGRG